jgi:DNA polymerase-3 subunit delta'
MAFTRAVALDYIRRAHEQDRLGHAYLIAGPSGSGKRGLASDIANLVNDDVSRDIFASRLADVRIAEPESKSRRILTEQIRELEHALQMRSANGRRKVAVILDADRLQPQAANAFLKTLEEPPRDSLLLLLTRLPEVLPDTIVSRCIAITLSAPEERIALPEEAELVRLLDSSTANRETGVQAAYRLAQAFQRLLSGVRESIQTENSAALKSEEARYKNTTDGAWLDDREDYFKALTESAYIERRARLVETVYVWWTDVLRANRGIERCDLPAARESTNAVATKISTPDILRRIRRVEELRDHLSRNIQEALAIEIAFLRIFAF